jgi:hypothetical protein
VAKKGGKVAKAIECVEARYEVEDVQFGKVYKWHPERIVLECQCGQRLSLTASRTSCPECGRDHVLTVQEASTDRRQSKETLHPWRFVEDREDAGLPV